MLKKEKIMTFSLILTGVLFILVCFNVGESIYKKLKIRKSVLVLLLGLTLVAYFIPNFILWGVSFSWVGFVLPLVFSFVTFFKIRHFKIFLRIFVGVLVAFVLSLVYNLISFEVYESVILQPYLALGAILGVVLLFVVQTPSRAYASIFVGACLADVVFYFSRYAGYAGYNLTLGGEKIFCVLMTSFVVSLVAYYFVRKVKTIEIRHRLKKAERKKI